jgi:hypothetical protein
MPQGGRGLLLDLQSVTLLLAHEYVGLDHADPRVDSLAHESLQKLLWHAGESARK